MPEPVRLNPDELKNKYGLSARLVMRIGALLKRRIGISDTLAESATPGTPVEKLLLSSALLNADNGLSAEILNEAFQTSGGQDELSLSDWNDWSVIAFAEEFDAEEGWEAAGTELAVVEPDDASLTMNFSGLEDTSDLFSAEEIRRLKLTAMTGAEVSERVSAIRQLVLSPESPQEKVTLFVNLLSDTEPRIRSESAAALERLGLNSEVSRAISDLAEGDSQQRLLAARRLTPLVQNGSELEVYVVLRSLLQSVSREPEVPVRAAILRTFAAAGHHVANHPNECREVLRLLVQQLREYPDVLRNDVDAALVALAGHSPQSVIDQLWALLQNESELQPRIYLLCFLSQQELPEEIRPPLIEQMAAQLGALPSNDEHAFRLGSLMVAHGELAAQALLETFPQAHRLQHTYFVELLNRIAAGNESEVSPEVKNEVAALFLRLLHGAERTVRLAVMESELCGDPDLSPETRSRVIQELFANLHDYHNPRTRDLVETTISKIGLPAVKPLIGIVNASPRQDERDVALGVLGLVFANIEESEEQLEEKAFQAIELCTEITEGDSVEFSAIALDALGNICTCPFIPHEKLREISEWLRQSLPKAQRPFELLRALGKICGNSTSPTHDRLDTTNLFLQLFRSDLPEVQTKVIEIDLEHIHHLGKEVVAFTEMIPTLLEGFQSISLAKEIPQSLRERVIEALLAKWRAVMDYREIWGPGNIHLLLSTLQELGMAETTSPEFRRGIIDAFQEDIEHPQVMAAIGDICFQSPEEPLISEITPAILQKAIGYWVAREKMDKADAPTILRSLGQMITVNPLGDDPQQAERIRSRILSLLFDAIRDKVRGMDEVLRFLAESPGIPEAERKEIQDRLRDVFALVRK